MKKLLILAILAMAVAVQGYAQPPRHHHHPHHAPVMPSWYVWDAIADYYYYEALRCRWWGSTWYNPHKVQVDCIEFKRTYSGRLRIKNGDLKKQYYSMWESNSWRFTCPSGIIVDVSTGNGRTKIVAYSKDGKKTSSHTLTASHTLAPCYYGYYYHYY